MRKLGRTGLSLLLVGWAGVARADLTRIDGRVVDAAGAPVVGIEVASDWQFPGGKPRASAGVRTDDAGRFHYEDDFAGQPALLIALDRERRVGGLIIIEPNQAPAAVTITVGPLVRVHGQAACSEVGKPLTFANVALVVRDRRVRVAQATTPTATWDFTVPVGSYQLNIHAGQDIQAAGRSLELVGDRPDVDLGTIDLKLSPLGRMYGHEPPPLHITAARGISPDIKLSDFRGKWVVLDFWGYWCGPCVGRSLPDLMQIWDEHPDERDQFVVLAFHDPQAATFAELDEKLAPIVREVWGGRALPFPILLDTTGQTVAEYGIRSWPTTILIDPEGKVVRGGEATLRQALPAVPVARRIPFALDRSIGFGLADGIELDEFAQITGQMAHIPIVLDEPALRAARIAPKSKIPLTLSAQLTLRSWLDLGLRPLGLVAMPGPEGLVITTLTGLPDQPEPSPRQALARNRIGRKLAETRVTCDGTTRSLAEVVAFVAEQTGEAVVLDPADRLAGRLDPQVPVTGRVTDAPLGDALKALLGPLGIEATVRDEALILGRSARP